MPQPCPPPISCRFPATFSVPTPLGAIFDDRTIADLQTGIVAGGANNQLSRERHGQALFERGILYAPDYVINAGGIISVATEYLGRNAGRVSPVEDVNALIERIPERLERVWRESDAEKVAPDIIADRLAQELIGRG